MKKKLTLILAAILAVCPMGLGLACGNGTVEITVVSSFYERKDTDGKVISKDGNRDNFVNAYTAFEAAQNGKVKIKDNSEESTDDWKKDVLGSFKNGKEPDVLFYYIGTDADELISGNKVVRISDIKKEYPDFTSNMENSLIPTATNGIRYAVPVNGYWEGMFVNKKVLADCGVDVDRVMGKNYTWEQFLDDCQTVKDNGKTPIAAAIGKYPHYFFEFCVMNNGDAANHLNLPQNSSDTAFSKWENGLDDIKELWEKGFFADNARAANTDEEVAAVELEIANGNAAFMIDGSWKIGFFNDNAADHVDDFAVTYVPGTSTRPSTQIISGISMGYYITKKAWDNPKKRKACVDFIMAMTSNEVASSFGALSALKDQKPLDNANSLQKSAITMVSGRSAEVGAVQDLLTPAVRDSLFAEIKNVLVGAPTAADALKQHLGIS